MIFGFRRGARRHQVGGAGAGAAQAYSDRQALSWNIELEKFLRPGSPRRPDGAYCQARLVKRILKLIRAFLSALPWRAGLVKPDLGGPAAGRPALASVVEPDLDVLDRAGETRPPLRTLADAAIFYVRASCGDRDGCIEKPLANASS